MSQLGQVIVYFQVIIFMILELYINGDAHGIGIQGGNNNIIEKNIIENSGTGITLYAYSQQELKNTIIRYNIVKNTHSLGGANNRGIETQCSNEAWADKTGNKIYYNIVFNCTTGYRFTFEKLLEFYNNIASNCNIGICIQRSYFDGDKTVGPKVKGRNNVVIGSNDQHVYFQTGAYKPDYVFDWDYNHYYPDGSQKFYFDDKAISGYLSDFDVWKSRGNDNNGPDITDPHFVDSIQGNFHTASASSPVINAGTNVGLSKDFEGNPIDGLPDIGAYEFSGTMSNTPTPPTGLRVSFY